MSQVNSKTLQLSILAAAMLSLSACSTTPTIAGVDLGQVGSGLSKVGSKTKEITSNAWEGTKNILNIGPNEPELLDEVDLALMEEDANLSAMQLASNDSQQRLPQDDVQAAWTDTLEDQPLLPQETAQQNTAVFGEVPTQPEVVSLDQSQELLDGEVLAANTQIMPADTPVIPEATVATQDLTHEVTENETLWDIAKRTTGDANNWHVIADINDLHPNASVFVGQKIIVPADMLKPVEAASVAVAQEEAAQPIMPEQTAAVALTIPEKSTDEAAVVATAEQIAPAAPANAANIMTDATALKVGAGETLWDFAKRTTGDATNWKQIADKNLFDEKQLAMIRPGQKIYVPTDMVRSRDANGVLIAKGAEGTIPTATVGGALPQDQEAVAATAAVLAGTNQPDGKVKIVEAAFQDNKGITPVTAESLSEEAAMAVAENASESSKVMVSGTYYPKAVYNEADFSSSLLMRVSPGTQLLVSKAIGPWLEVKTDKGIGYVHSRDIK